MLAPKRWHVPTEDDWVILENYLIFNGYNNDGTNEVGATYYFLSTERRKSNLDY